jgi:hypothetical protein
MNNPDLIQNLLDIESREELLNDLMYKRDSLIKELQNLNSKLPVIIEQNKKVLLFKHNSTDYLNKYNDEINKIEQEQYSLIQNLKTSLKEKVDSLLVTEKYKSIKKQLNLSKDELVNTIFNDLISEKMKEIEFIN